MPAHPSSSPLPGRRALGVTAVAVLAVVLVGCSGSAPRPPADGASRPAAGSATGAPTARVTSPTPTPSTDPDTDPSAVAGALDDLLARRDTALAAGDLAAFTDTVADPTSTAGRAQLSAFRAARALRVTGVEHDVVAPVDDPSAVDVTLRYRVGGVDRAGRTATVRHALARVGGRWTVASEAPVEGDPAPPWLAMPGLRVVRTGHAVVAGTAGSAALREAAATVDRALPPLARVWSGTPRRTLVLVPDSAAEARALGGASTATVGEVAASTDGPLGADGRATGDRVLLDPDVRRRLSATGREVVLTHELAHVAVRATLPGAAPTWLAEGYADHVGYARSGLPQRTLAARLLSSVRDGTAPTELPDATALDPAVGDIEVGYLASWQAAETVVALRGEAALRALVRACTVTGGTEAAEDACAAAMPEVLGTDRAGLTRRWQERLGALAR